MNKISKNTLTKRQKEVVSIFEELMPHLKTTKTISRKEIIELLEMCEKNWDGKSKKVSKFFKDEKLPILARQKTGILCDAKDQILGIIPLRQDRRFAADEKTEKTINIIFEK